MEIRFPDVRDAAAALMAAALDKLASAGDGPVFAVFVGRDGWRRSGSESLVLARREAWQHPIGLAGDGWWHRLPQMETFSSALDAHPELSGRVDTMVGFPFSLANRPLPVLLAADLLTPLVEASRTYSFDHDVFDAAYARVEAGLLADTVRLVQAVPLLGFETAVYPEVRLGGDLVIRLMTEPELSAAVELGLPAQAPTTPLGRMVPRTYQYALVKVTPYPVQVGSPPDPVTVPEPIEDDARRLQTALRLMCGGSVTLGRSIQMQHEGDFDAGLGYSASLAKVELPDEDHRTLLGTPGQVAQVVETMTLLAAPAIAGHRPLQMALRRLIAAGSRGLAEDGLVDLTIAAEALFIHAAGKGRTKRKGNPIAQGAAALLGGDAELGASASDIHRFIAGAYLRRNHEVHADPGAPPAAHLLDGTLASSLTAVVRDLERVMRRAVTLTMQQLAVSGP